MARNLNARKNGIGEPSSKYGYDHTGLQFDKDIQEKQERFEFLYGEFIKFMQSHDVDPRLFRSMFTRYYEEYIKEVNI